MKYNFQYWDNRVQEQRRWIRDCGGSLLGYADKMPRRSLVEVGHIYNADNAELARLLQKRESCRRPE